MNNIFIHYLQQQYDHKLDIMRLPGGALSSLFSIRENAMDETVAKKLWDTAQAIIMNKYQHRRKQEPL